MPYAQKTIIEMKTLKINFVLIFSLFLPFCYGPSAQAAAPDDTMLMFVGESEPVTTVASVYPESPLSAPAIVTLVSREEIEAQGYQTLGELLSFQPGFYIEPGGRGSVATYRGLRDSVLFLYDGVPITTDVTKSFAPLDNEFSLEAVERVEIIKGPGSVLWGLDAFAAVVNIVPASGAGRPTISVSTSLGQQQLAKGSLQLATAGKQGDAYLFVSAAQETYHNDQYSLTQQAPQTIEPSKYFELVGSLNYRKWLHLSGRWSDFSRQFTMSNIESADSWRGTKELPFNYLKLSATAEQGPSHYSLNGFVQQTRYQVRDVDIERIQRNTSTQLELLWDRRLFSRGLLTSGVSWRRNQVDGALVRDGFQPGFVNPVGNFFVPVINQKDFSSDIYSVFSQFRYRWGIVEWWLGGRYEKHSEYADNLSSSLGVQAPLGADVRAKLSYGSAYRSPYSRQLFGDTSLSQEHIQSLSGQLSWTPGKKQSYALTLFYNQIKDHRAEDPFGGLSRADSRDMYGAELSLRFPLFATLSAQAELSWVDAGNEEDHYRQLAFSIVRPDGSREDQFDSWSQPSRTGPEWMARLKLNWAITPSSNLGISFMDSAAVVGSYSKGEQVEKFAGPQLVNLVWNGTQVFHPNDRLILRISNLLDHNYTTPDIYGPAGGPPRQISLSWKISF